MRKRKTWKLLLVLMLAAISARAYAAEDCAEHDYQWTEKEATCLASGYRGYVCTACGQQKDFTVIPQLKHDYGQWVTVEEPSCNAEGLAQRWCSQCPSVEENSIGKLAHTYTVRTQQPSCGRDGYTLYTCSVCGHEEKTDVVEKLGHNYVVTVIAPTCTADGYTRHKCANCGDAYRTDHIEKTGHWYDGGVETKEPTLTTMGRITYTCFGCGDTYQETTPKWIDPFEDLDKKQYYYNAVLWAYNSGVAFGTDSTHFCPDEICTRAQVVTFLWREAGEPDPIQCQCSFVDVVPGSYYEKAVLWAVEQGITAGVGGSHFAPCEPCTRSQVVSFLYRAKGSPAVDSKVTFSDVKAGDYFYDAVCWAYAEGVTAGTGGTTFSPVQSCTRAEVVTFLYRAKKI